MTRTWIRGADARPITGGEPASIAARQARVLRSVVPSIRAKIQTLGSKDVLVIDASAPDRDWEFLPYDARTGVFRFSVVRAITTDGSAIGPSAEFRPPPLKLVVSVDPRGDLGEIAGDLLARARALARDSIIDLHGATVRDLAIRVLRWNPRMIAILTHGDDGSIDLHDRREVGVDTLAQLLHAMPSSALRLAFLGACDSFGLAPGLLRAGLPWAIAFDGAPNAVPIREGIALATRDFGHSELPKLLLDIRNAIAAPELDLGLEPNAALRMRVLARDHELRVRRRRPAAAQERCSHPTSDWLRQFVGRDPLPETGLAIVAACASCQQRVADLRERYRTAAQEAIARLVEAAPDVAPDEARRSFELRLASEAAVGHLLETGLMIQPKGWIGGASPWPALLPGPGVTTRAGMRGCVLQEALIDGELRNLDTRDVQRVSFGALTPHELPAGRYKASAWSERIGVWDWQFEVTAEESPATPAFAVLADHLDQALLAYVENPVTAWTVAHAAMMRRQELTAPTCPRLANACGGTAQWLESELLR